MPYLHKLGRRADVKYQAGDAAIRRLAIARAISAMGSAAATIALAYEIYATTGSGAYLAATFIVVLGVTGIISPVGGVIADRYDRRTVMMISELSGAATFAVMAVVRSPVALIGVAFIGACVRIPFVPAADASIPNMVPAGRLAWANSIIASSSAVGQLLGPALGGVLVATFNAKFVFVVNSLSFVISALIIRSIKTATAHQGGPRGEREHKGVLAGYRFVFGQSRILRLGLAWWAIIWLAVNVGFVADPALAKLFHAGSVGYGLIDTAYAAAGLLGALIANRLIEWWGSVTITLAAVGTAAGCVIVGFAGWFTVVLLGVGISAFFGSAGDIIANIIVQQAVPDSVRGRVFAALTSMGLIASMLGYVVAGVVLSAIGAKAVYLLGAAAAIVAAWILLPLRHAKP